MRPAEHHQRAPRAAAERKVAERGRQYRDLHSQRRRLIRELEASRNEMRRLQGMREDGIAVPQNQISDVQNKIKKLKKDIDSVESKLKNL